MAIVTTALNMVADYVPFERPPQPQTLWSAIPRGLFTGIVNAGVLDAKPINDSQVLTCTIVLPNNFGYVMADAQLLINQDRAQDWSEECFVRLLNFYRGADSNVNGFETHYRQELLRTSAFGLSVAMSVVQPWPTFPIIAPQSTGGTIVVMRANNGTATAALAGTVMAFVSFWQFDLEQIRKFPINTPLPVHSR